jgi:hypothetical protein
MNMYARAAREPRVCDDNVPAQNPLIWSIRYGAINSARGCAGQRLGSLL